GARVERILVEGGRAVGVALQDGETRRADIVVSAADGHATIFDMLKGRFTNGRIRRKYETYKTFPSYLQVSLGVGADLKGEPGTIVLFPDEIIRLDPDTTAESLTCRIFHFDPTMAPPGKTAVTCLLPTYNEPYWSDLRRQDPARYEAEKLRVAAAVTAAFEARFAGARGRIEVVDVATPATVVRYTGNWKGSMEGWLYTPATGIRPLPCVLPGLRNFYMVGQWIAPGGGLPSALMTARSVSKRIARESGIRWKLA
ncbi:MAG TPA: NAD(P)/FAD-dependent oxidoreductase, partial [Kiritimatiellia bacterium]|nr:NAD(P)/FAD-dependent oxidoreductase [Kiritimatiellia bacterium]